MSKWHGGKGSRTRPTDHNKFADNYDRIFRKKREQALDELSQLSQDMGEYHTPRSFLATVKILKCSDAQRWYSKHVGKLWNVLEDCGEEWKCRSADGYLNFILKEDCERVDVN